MQQEIWAKCHLLPDHYEVSNLGNVRYWKKGLPMKKSISINKGGYPSIGVKKKKILVHRLVAICFIPNPLNLPVVHHIDENKENSSYANLMWTTHRGNIIDYYRRRGKKDIYQYTVNGDFIRKHEIANDYKQYGYSIHSICECVNGNKRLRSYMGFVFTNGERSQEYFQKLPNWNPAKARPINQIDKNGNHIKTWQSQADAERTGLYTQSGISKVLIGINKTHKDYFWEYAD